MSDYCIDTPRLLLRPMVEQDLDDLLTIFTDPQVMAAFQSPLFSRAQMQHWLQRNLAHQNEYGYGLFSVILKSEGILIGDCGLETMQVDGAVVTELGYDFRSDYWRHGFATEAASAVREFAFNTLRLPGLISLIRVGNTASQRVAEKIGMRLDRQTANGEILYWVYAQQAPQRASEAV